MRRPSACTLPESHKGRYDRLMATDRLTEHEGHYQGSVFEDEQGYDWEERSYQKGCEVARDEAERQLCLMEEDLFRQRPSEWKVVSWQERTLLTRFGEIRVRRRLYRDESGTYHYLLDEHLGWRAKQLATPSVTKSAVRMASWMPFEDVAETLSEVTAGALSVMSIHRLLQRVGAQAVQEEVWKKCFEDGEDVAEGERVVDVLYTEADGVWIHLQREEQKHYEVKSGIVYEGWKKIRPSQDDRYSLEGKRVAMPTKPSLSGREPALSGPRCMT